MTAAFAIVVLATISASNVSGDVTVVSEGHLFAEGPQWIPGKGLIFADVVGDTIYRGDRTVFRKPSERTNGIALDPQGRVLMCESKPHRITRMESDGKITVLADKYDGKSFNSTNDIAVRSDGLIYFTDPGAKSTGELTINGVYMLDPASKKVTLLSDKLKYPNGIDFSPDQKTLYVADYMGGAIYAYDVAADGTVSHERPYATVESPDGFTVDAEGKLWVASKKGVAVIGLKGETLETLAIPTPPTNCCFGEADGKTLYITARSKVFRVKTTVAGIGRF